VFVKFSDSGHRRIDGLYHHDNLDKSRSLLEINDRVPSKKEDPSNARTVFDIFHLFISVKAPNVIASIPYLTFGAE
jgi:hypothetical protein